MKFMDKEILEEYNKLKKIIIQKSIEGNIEETMEKVFQIWMFMNRFRNCDLGFYFDEDLHQAIQKLNKNNYKKTHLLKKKNKFKIAYIISNFSATGGASIPHRFMLENINIKDPTFEQFVLVSNLSSKEFDKNSSTYKYLQEYFVLADFVHLPSNMKWFEKAQYIESWILKNEIDFVIVDPCPASLYAIASKPALIHAILSQDCYTFTLGPGSGDITFLVTNDQIFKYSYNNNDSENKIKVVMLPLHSKVYINKSRPLDLSIYNIPKNAVVSATSNLWKVCFGDSETLLNMVADLARCYPDYHHIFVGTERCLENLTFFLNKNKDIEDQIHFIGAIDNIYRLLKSIDFWINSFPTSGGSDIEAAMVGIPSIEIITNRNLNLHGVEFLRSRECEVVNIYEFKKLANKLINDKDYRKNLGSFLQLKIEREFDKSRIINEDIYMLFKDKFNDLLDSNKEKHIFDTHRIFEYEKRIALYNSFGLVNWDNKKKIRFLDNCIKEFPEKPFAWIKKIEMIIENNNQRMFLNIINKINIDLKKDPRILTMIMIGYEKFFLNKKALELANMIVNLKSKFSTVSEDLAKNVIDRHENLEFKNKNISYNFPYFYNY